MVALEVARCLLAVDLLTDRLSRSPPQWFTIPAVRAQTCMFDSPSLSAIGPITDIIFFGKWSAVPLDFPDRARLGRNSGEGSGDGIGASRTSLAQEEERCVDVEGGGEEEECLEMKRWRFSSRTRKGFNCLSRLGVPCRRDGLIPVVQDEVTILGMGELARNKGLDNCWEEL